MRQPRGAALFMAGVLAMVAAGPGTSTARAEVPTRMSASSATELFDAAQRAMGLSTKDATRLQSGISVIDRADSATVTTGDLTVQVSAADTRSEVTTLSNGARVMSLLEAGQSSADFTVDVPQGATLEPAGRGFRIVMDMHGSKLIIGELQPPWAVDSRGVAIPTSYTLHGKVLTQTVNGRRATYPVVADPTFTFGWAGASEGPGVYWNMTGLQAKLLGSITVAVLGTSLAGGCIGASRIPRVGYLVSGLCGFIGAPKLEAIWKQMAAIFRNTTVKNAACYQIKVLPVGKKLSKVNARNCA